MFLLTPSLIHILTQYIFIFIVIIIFTLAWICSSDQKHHPIRLSQFLSHIFVRIGQLGICSKIRLLSFNVNELLNFGNPDIFYLWINLKNWKSIAFFVNIPTDFRFIRMMKPSKFNSTFTSLFSLCEEAAVHNIQLTLVKNRFLQSICDLPHFF